MTRAIDIAKKNNITYIVHEYMHDPQNNSYGLEASQKLGVKPQKVFKTLVVMLSDNSYAVAIVPTSSMLNMKLMAKASNTKKCSMADSLDVERISGYILGGVSPLGQKKRLKTIIDISAKEYNTIFISAGKRGLDIELNPNDLQKLTNANFANICQ